MSARLTALFIFVSLAVICEAQSPDQITTHQQAAHDAEARQDFATAIREFQTLAHWLPQSAEAQSNLGVALYFHHDLEQSVVAFAHAIALDPTLNAPHLFRGIALQRLAQPDAAVPELKKAISINSSDPLAHTWLGYAYAAQSRYEQASAELEVAGQQQPLNPDIWYSLGQCYLEMGKLAVSGLVAAYPDGGRAWQLAGEQLEAQGNKTKALELYAKALSKRPDLAELRAKLPGEGTAVAAPSNPDLERSEDALYQRVRDYEKKAKNAFSTILRIDPDNYRAHQVMGDSYVAADQLDAAIGEYRTVIRLKPDLPGIHESIGTGLLRTAKVQEALAEFKAEIAVAPYSPQAYVDAGRVYLLTENDMEAASVLEKALGLYRPPSAAYKLLGKLYLKREQYKAAAEAISKYLKLEPEDSSAYYLLARAYKATGNVPAMNRAILDYKRTADAAKSKSAAENALNVRDPSEDLIDDKRRE